MAARGGQPCLVCTFVRVLQAPAMSGGDDGGGVSASLSKYHDGPSEGEFRRVV